MRRLLGATFATAFSAAVFVSCDDEPGRATGDAGTDAALTAPDGSVAAPSTGCLDQPGALERPPAGSLPCDLIPPGLTP
jgi:hypothetical protein